MNCPEVDEIFHHTVWNSTFYYVTVTVHGGRPTLLEQCGALNTQIKPNNDVILKLKPHTPHTL